MNWNIINSIADVEAIKEKSVSVPCMIFKHSTTCSISVMAKSRLEKNWDLDATEIVPYYLDLKVYKPVSNYIAETFAVHHESPQALIIVDGACVFDESHLDIQVSEFKEFV